MQHLERQWHWFPVSTTVVLRNWGRTFLRVGIDNQKKQAPKSFLPKAWYCEHIFLVHLSNVYWTKRIKIFIISFHCFRKTPESVPINLRRFLTLRSFLEELVLFRKKCVASSRRSDYSAWWKQTEEKGSHHFTIPLFQLDVTKLFHKFPKTDLHDKFLF